MNSDVLEVRVLEPDEFAAAPIELPSVFAETGRGAAHYSSCHVALASRQNSPVAAAALAVAHAGYGRIWAPYLAADAPRGALEILLREAERFLGTIRPSPPRHIRVVLDRDDVVAARRFTAHGFDLHTSICHLLCCNCGLQNGSPRGRLSFHQANADDFPAFQEILRQTYADSRDCPDLMSQLDEEDVRIRWQQSAGAGQSGNWLIAKLNGNEAGCLVMDRGTECAQSELVSSELVSSELVSSELVSSELVYMGLIPDYRGLRLGDELVRWARRLACQTGKNRLTVSVDVGNACALACYARNGFVRYAESDLFVKSIS